MIQYRIYAAPPVDESPGEVVEVREELTKYLTRRFGGVTCSPTVGGWLDSGKVCIETGIVWEVITNAGRPEIDDAASYIRALLRQKEVLVTRTPVESWSVGT